MRSYNPNFAETMLVWAVPISLAATEGITIVFSSSDYLDVSVHQVCILQAGYPVNGMGCPIRKFTLITVICTSV